jgi:hypothetical protein
MAETRCNVEGGQRAHGVLHAAVVVRQLTATCSRSIREGQETETETETMMTETERERPKERKRETHTHTHNLIKYAGLNADNDSNARPTTRVS